MNSKFVKIFLIFCLLTTSSTAKSQYYLQPVIVKEYYVYYGGFGGGYNFLASNYGAVNEAYVRINSIINQAGALSNVRCTGEAYRNVTSRNDSLTRWLAAEAVFRALKQSVNLWQQVMGRTPWQNGTLTVYYADGGSEQYLVTNPTFSAALAGGAGIPGTLKDGGGQIKPHPICG